MTARVLLVEDEAISAMAIRIMIESRDCAVLEVACSGHEAISLATELNPDLILMDVRLRGEMSGIDAAKAIQEYRYIPVIIMTAYSIDELREEYDALDSFLFVTKPIEEEQLIKAIAVVTGQNNPAISY